MAKLTETGFSVNQHDLVIKRGKLLVLYVRTIVAWLTYEYVPMKYNTRDSFVTVNE